MAKPDTEVQHHDHPEMNGIHSDTRDDRQQDRRADQDGRRHVEQTAEHQQHDVDHEQDHVLVARQREEERRDLRRNLHERHDVADRRGTGDERHYHRDGPQRSMHERRKVAPPIVTIDNPRYEERPNAGNVAGLDRREYTTEYAAEDNPEGDQPPESVERDLERFAQGHGLAPWMPVAIGHVQA